jgi:hypothetical protein
MFSFTLITTPKSTLPSMSNASAVFSPNDIAK